MSKNGNIIRFGVSVDEWLKNGDEPDFKNMEEVKAKLYESSAVMDWVYTDDGLVVGFRKDTTSKAVNIDVY